MSHRFNRVPWAKQSSIYEVNIRQYTPEGSFRSFSTHLPRLQEMGIDILWLMPITPISEKGRQGSLGSYYACSSYTDINPEFGTADDLHALIDQAHTLGMKVIIDWVANHTGCDHHWTTENPDWYLRDQDGNFMERNGWKDVIDLDYGSKSMRQAMIAAMQFWVKNFSIDGFRCDMAHLVPLDFWIEVRTQLEVNKPLYWLAECEEVSYHEVFDTTYAWWWMHETEKYVKGTGSLHQVREVLHAYTQYPPEASKLFFTSNHDENSWNGTETEKYGLAAKAWAVFTCTWQAIPLIYSGQELPNKKRLAFFDKDCIEWNGNYSLHGFYQQLLQLRKSSPAIIKGETFILPSEHSDSLMCYFRKHEKDTVLVLINVSIRDRLRITVNHAWLNGLFNNPFSGLAFQFNGTESFELQAGEFLIYQSKQSS